MAIAFVTSEQAGAANNATTSAIDTSGANFLVAAIADTPVGGGFTFSDSKGNTWQALTSYISTATGARTRIYYAYNATVGSGHTFAVADVSGASYCSICVAAFSGVQTSPNPYNTDVVGVNDYATSSTFPLQAGSVTIAGGHLAISVVSNGSFTGGTWASVDSSFTIAEHIATVGGSHIGGALAYWINGGGSTAVNPAWTPAQAVMEASGSNASFTAAAGGGGRTTKNTRSSPLGVNLGMGWRMPR